jgi:hypothetical protein
MLRDDPDARVIGPTGQRHAPRFTALAADGLEVDHQ